MSVSSGLVGLHWAQDLATSNRSRNAGSARLQPSQASPNGATGSRSRAPKATAVPGRSGSHRAREIWARACSRMRRVCSPPRLRAPCRPARTFSASHPAIARVPDLAPPARRWRVGQAAMQDRIGDGTSGRRSRPPPASRSGRRSPEPKPRSRAGSRRSFYSGAGIAGPIDDPQTPVRARSGLPGTAGGGTGPGGHVEDQRQLRRHHTDGPLRPRRGWRVTGGRRQPALLRRECGERPLLVPELRRHDKFLIIAPKSAGSRFDAGLGRTGERANIVKMVEYVVAQNGANPKKVFAAGPSSGACMAQALLASYPDVFAGGSSLAGVPAGAWTGGGAYGWSAPASTTAQQWGDKVRNAFPGFTGSRPRVQFWQGMGDTNLTYSQTYPAQVAQWTNVFAGDGCQRHEGKHQTAGGREHLGSVLLHGLHGTGRGGGKQRPQQCGS